MISTLAGIATINTALERSTKGQRKMIPHRIACELAALQFSTMPRNSDWLTCHARCANKALDLGSDIPRNGYTCSTRTVRNLMASMGYHKRIRDENSTSAPTTNHYASLDVKNVYTGPTKSGNEFCGLMNLEVLEACLKAVCESLTGAVGEPN